MQVTYIGLSEYFQRCIPKAKRKGYFLIISLLNFFIYELFGVHYKLERIL